MNFFDPSEFTCPCCKKGNPQTELYDLLKLARLYADIPFVLNSAVRCEKHNKEVGGSPTSSHLDGWAVDIRVQNSHERFRVVYGLIQAGFNRIEVRDTWVHADCDPSKDQEVLW